MGHDSGLLGAVMQFAAVEAVMTEAQTPAPAA
jgi:hypothetical protein